jgi:hypothetical protein
MLCFLPANKYAALDVKFGITKKATLIPFWCVGIIQLQIGLVYFFAGIAKINTGLATACSTLKNMVEKQRLLSGNRTIIQF